MFRGTGTLEDTATVDMRLGIRRIVLYYLISNSRDCYESKTPTMFKAYMAKQCIVDKAVATHAPVKTQKNTPLKET